MTMRTEFYLIVDAKSGQVYGDMEHDNALERYNDDCGDDEYIVHKIVIETPEHKNATLVLPSTVPQVTK